MADYIRREALLKMIGTMPSSPITDREERLIRAFISTVKNFPAADVRPVVLCRDCVIPHNKWTGCPKLNGTIVCDEDFCSHGVKIVDKRDVCDGCKTCEYFNNKNWNCRGAKEICPTYMADFRPNCGADMEES